MNFSFLNKNKNKKEGPEEEERTKLILEKNGILFNKIKNNIFNVHFKIANNHVHLPAFINFDFIRLIYDLNTDVYDYVSVTKSDDHNAYFLITMKHFFKDFGLPQRYSSIHVTQQQQQQPPQQHSATNTVEFYGKTVLTHKPPNLPEKAELLPLEHMNMKFIVLSNHEVEVHVELIFEENFSLLPMVEKMVGMIIYKIFNKTKQFIQCLRP